MEAETSSNQRPVIQASEILAKIERGEDVEYDGVIVEGDLDISGLNLPTEQVNGGKLIVISSQVKITNSEIRGNVNFSNSCFQKLINFEGSQFTGEETEFSETKFDGPAIFCRTEFSNFTAFWTAQFDGKDVNFENAQFYGQAGFDGAQFNRGEADFEGTQFDGYAGFDGAQFNGGDANFGRARFRSIATFEGAQFTGGISIFVEAQFDGLAVFDRAIFGWGVYMNLQQFHKNVSFKYTKYDDPSDQEWTSRIAKRKMEDYGNKNDADYYFYREMEAIRIRNGINSIRYEDDTPPSNIPARLSQFRTKITQMPYKIKRFLIYDVLEYIFIQRVFGYGVRPFNVAKAWLIVVFALGFVYWAGSGVEKANNTLEWYEYFYFSIVTAATPGYAGYTPASGLYTLIAGAEAIFGTFMWAAFIATFARKWQR